MNEFIQTLDGWINLAFVAEIKEQGDRVFVIDREGRARTLPRNTDVTEILMKSGMLLPADPGYSVVFYGFDGDEFWHMLEPIIAFRISSIGIVPVSLNGSPLKWGTWTEGWAIQTPKGDVVISEDVTAGTFDSFKEMMKKRHEARAT